MKMTMNEAFCNSSYMGEPSFYTVTQTSWLKEVSVIWIIPSKSPPRKKKSSASIETRQGKVPSDTFENKIFEGNTKFQVV